jgi:hypothetical protein
MKCPHCGKDIPISKSVGENASFDFLNDPQEDIYTAEDGKPINPPTTT